MRKADYFFFIMVAFLGGIFLAGSGIIKLLPLLTIMCAASIFIFLYTRKIAHSIIFLVVVFGFFYYYLFINSAAINQKIPYERKLSFSVVIVDEPKLSERSQIFTGKLNEPFYGKISVITSPIPEYKYGDEIFITGTINKVSPFIGKLPTVVFPSIKLISERHGFLVRAWLIDVKHKVVSGFEEILPKDAAALLSGIMLGSVSGFDVGLKNAMAKSGTTHLVALSGYNITILVFVVNYLFGSFLSRRATLWFTAIFILLFVIMAGGGASIVRAAIMGFLVLLAQNLGRLYNMRNSIIFSAFLMVIFNPYLLNFDLGFELSFLSLLGIVYLRPALEYYFFKSSGKKFSEATMLDWKNQLLTTSSAQLMVMPILIYAFGQFSALSFLANILVLEFIPLTMFLGFVIALLQFIFSPLAFLLAKIVSLLLFYELWIIRFFALFSLPFPGILENLVIAILYYSVILYFIYEYQMRRKHAYEKSF